MSPKYMCFLDEHGNPAFPSEPIAPAHDVRCAMLMDNYFDSRRSHAWLVRACVRAAAGIIVSGGERVCQPVAETGSKDRRKLSDFLQNEHSISSYVNKIHS